MKTLRFIFAGLALFTGLQAWSAPVVITNPSLGAETIDADTIRSVFRGKKVAWGNKSAVIVAVLKGGAVHDAFLKQAFNISASSFSNYWRLTTMSGGATAPKEFANEDELLKFVAATPGAIGYLDETKLNTDVRSIALP
jgi:ABC-type phosphate transport system substrate-binding protein